MEHVDRAPAPGPGKLGRPVRNRRYSRRVYGGGHRPTKRLFTPEIKRFLKDWLVRRRENPYPNREEKKLLANDTGLTYIQICNWFANWRRKLKNVSAERRQKTWGHLIKTYNDCAQGNVEQFSICSEDSIWEESDPQGPRSEDDSETASPTDVSQCYHVSSTTEDKLSNPNKYSFKYLTTQDNQDPLTSSSAELSGALLLSKWLESAARFQPSEANYSWWNGVKSRNFGCGLKQDSSAPHSKHGKDEVEAAVALTALASADCYTNATRTAAPSDDTFIS